MALRPPEPALFEHLLQAVEVEVAHLVRLSRRPATEPWWSRSAAHRFDDPEKAFGVCYLAGRLDTAFCESVIHQSALFVGGQYAVAGADLPRALQPCAEADLDEGAAVGVVAPDGDGTGVAGRLGVVAAGADGCR